VIVRLEAPGRMHLYLTVGIDRQKIARFGINVANVQEIITTAVGGEPATQVYKSERRFPPLCIC